MRIWIILLALFVMFWHVVKVIKNMLEDSLRNPYHNAYLTDLSFNEIGKLYLKDSIIPMDNNVTFALLDTISYCKRKILIFS